MERCILTSILLDTTSPVRLCTMSSEHSASIGYGPRAGADKRGPRFWLIFFANLVVDLLSALDLTAVSTALPTIVEQLHGSDFIWDENLFYLDLSHFFAIGSAICGSAQSLNMLIAGRVVQGIGGGGCISVTEIIYADLVPLPERGKFVGITASVWAFACAIGPPIGGALSGSNAWRWLFFLNIPLCAIAFLLVTLFLKVQTPREGLRNMISTVDWVGLILLVTGTISITISLAWAGIEHPWSSKQVLVPFCVGFGAIGAFIIVEYKFRVAKVPTIPSFLVTNRTTLSGYIGTSIHGIVSMAAIFYIPVYFQACKLDSPIRSGIDLLGFAFVIPVLAILSGVSVQLMDRYRPQNYIGWMFTMVGFGLFTLLDKDSSKSTYIGFQVVLGVGLGIIWISTQFPILAPLPFSNNAHALAFFTFVRCFSQTWGTVFGGTILQNTLKARLPAQFIDTFGSGAQLTYAVIQQINALPVELRDQVRDVFAQGVKIVWYTMLGISGLGLLSCLLMEEVKLRNALDEAWGMDVTDCTELGLTAVGAASTAKEI
ncbi:putative iron permease [Mycena venus]|uniref:Putative iron permease n=1 Tax=Mycena venus TaxID=2733690 RepID=A0A8H6X6V1_9AGAR|nr:putative iron permease [Mycena venus]